MDNIINELLPDKLTETGAGLPPERQNEIFDRESAVHIMPAQFLGNGSSSPSAHKFGLLILAVGILLLFAFSGLGYYFLFMKKPARPALIPPVEEEIALEPEKPDITEPAAVEEEISEPSEIQIEDRQEIASTSATSTIATSSALTDKFSDKDEDGLSDQEEVIFNTNPEQSDTDGDSYTDHQELTNLYNPAGGGQLAENPGLSSYRASSYNYRFLFPKGWELDRIDGDNSLILTAPDKQFVQIVVQPNSGRQTIDEWYRDQFKADVIGADLFYARNGWQGLYLEDRLTFYLTDAAREYLVAIAYNPNNDSAHFKNIFQLAIDSFIFSDALGD